MITALLLAAAVEQPPPLPESLELAAAEAFAFSVPCKTARLISAPRGVTVEAAGNRVLIGANQPGSGTVALACVEAVPAAWENVGGDQVRVECPKGSTPDAVDKATGERQVTCLTEKHVAVAVVVTALPPKTRVPREDGAENVLFVGEARALWPRCRIARIAVSNSPAALDGGPSGTVLLRAYSEGLAGLIAFCADSGRLSMQVRVLPFAP